MVEGINSQMGQAALSVLAPSSSNEENDTSTIKSEIKSSGRSYSAQEIAEKYDISLADAQKILDEIKKEEGEKNTSQNTKYDIPDSPQKEESEPPSTITYRV